MTSHSNQMLGVKPSTLDQLSIEDKKKIPVEVYTQLSKDFVPAAKEIAHTGSELLQSYQLLQKSFDQYIQAIGTLVKSSKKTFPKARAYGDDLGELAAQCTQILERHKKCIREFSSIVTKTNEYSAEEEDKLKGMLNKFQKDEKDIKKQCKKGLKEYEVNRNDATSETRSTSTTANDSTSRSNQSAHDFVRLPSSAGNSPRRSPTRKQEMLVLVDAAAATRTEPTPIIEASAQVTHQAVATSAAVSRVSGNNSGQSFSRTNEETGEMRMTSDKNEIAERKNNVKPLPPRKIAVPSMGHHYVEESMDYRPFEPVAKLSNRRRPPVGGRMVLPPLAERFPQYDADWVGNAKTTSLYDSAVSENTRKVLESEVPPLFHNSDYGRTLTVNENFIANSGEQITVSPGDKVVLIKNGSRGWIFVKDAGSQRTGWIPAPLVNY